MLLSRLFIPLTRFSRPLINQNRIVFVVRQSSRLQQISRPPWYRRFWPLTIAVTLTSTGIPISFLIYRNLVHNQLWNNDQIKDEEETIDNNSESVSQSELDNLLSETENLLNNELYSTRSSTVVVPIRLFFRTIKLVIIFTPVIIFYFIQDKLFPKLYETWCLTLKRSFALCGPCFIKLGQWMATRPDLFSSQFCQIFMSLHSNAPTHSLAQTKRLLKENKIDAEFWPTEENSTPLASGAIAQVYRCHVKDTDLIMKIRHPDVQNKIYCDLKIMNVFIRVITRFLPKNSFQWLNLEENIQSFTKNMLLQTNLLIESKNLKIFEKNFEKYRSKIRFPHVYTNQPATKDVLFQSYEQGISINEFLKICNDSQVRKKLAHIGVNAYLKMVFVDNFVHADLHPGNMLVRLNPEKTDETTLVFLDVGLTSSLTRTDKKNFYDLFRAIANYDAKEAASLMIERAPNALKIDESSKVGFRKDMSLLIDRVIRTPLKQLEVGLVLRNVLDLGKKYNIQVDSNFTTIALGTIIIEGIGRQLDPDLDFISAARPYLQKDFRLVKAYLGGVFYRNFPLTRTN